MIPNLSIIEIENEVLRSRYSVLKEVASTLAYEVETKLCRTESREEIFKAVDRIKQLTAKKSERI